TTRSLSPPLRAAPPAPRSFPTRRSSDLVQYSIDGRKFLSKDGLTPDDPISHEQLRPVIFRTLAVVAGFAIILLIMAAFDQLTIRSEEHTSELQSRFDLVCRLLLEKKKRT